MRDARKKYYGNYSEQNVKNYFQNFALYENLLSIYLICVSSILVKLQNCSLVENEAIKVPIPSTHSLQLQLIVGIIPTERKTPIFYA